MIKEKLNPKVNNFLDSVIFENKSQELKSLISVSKLNSSKGIDSPKQTQDIKENLKSIKGVGNKLKDNLTLQQTIEIAEETVLELEAIPSISETAEQLTVQENPSSSNNEIDLESTNSNEDKPTENIDDEIEASINKKPNNAFRRILNAANRQKDGFYYMEYIDPETNEFLEKPRQVKYPGQEERRNAKKLVQEVERKKQRNGYNSDNDYKRELRIAKRQANPINSQSEMLAEKMLVQRDGQLKLNLLHKLGVIDETTYMLAKEKVKGEWRKYSPKRIISSAIRAGAGKVRDASINAIGEMINKGAGTGRKAIRNGSNFIGTGVNKIGGAFLQRQKDRIRKKQGALGAAVSIISRNIVERANVIMKTIGTAGRALSAPLTGRIRSIYNLQPVKNAADLAKSSVSKLPKVPSTIAKVFSRGTTTLGFTGAGIAGAGKSALKFGALGAVLAVGGIANAPLLIGGLAVSGAALGAVEGVTKHALNSTGKLPFLGNALESFRMNNSWDLFRKTMEEQTAIFGRMQSGRMFTNTATAIRSISRAGNWGLIGSAGGLLVGGPAGALIGTIGGLGLGAASTVLGDKSMNFIIAKASQGLTLEVIQALPLGSALDVIQGNMWLGGAVDYWFNKDSADPLAKALYGLSNPMSAVYNLTQAGMYGFAQYSLYRALMNGIGSINGYQALIKVAQSSRFFSTYLPRAGGTALGGIIGASIASAIGAPVWLGAGLGMAGGYTATVGITRLLSSYGTVASGASRLLSLANAATSIVGTGLGSILASVVNNPVGIFAAIGGLSGSVIGSFFGPLGTLVGGTSGTFLGSFVDRFFRVSLPVLPNPIVLLQGLYNLWKLFTERITSLTDYANVAVTVVSLISFLAILPEIFPLNEAGELDFDCSSDNCQTSLIAPSLMQVTAAELNVDPQKNILILSATNTEPIQFGGYKKASLQSNILSLESAHNRIWEIEIPIGKIDSISSEINKFESVITITDSNVYAKIYETETANVLAASEQSADISGTTKKYKQELDLCALLPGNCR